MFKSSQRAIVFPQSEHLRLVGALAFHWGNPVIEAPPVPQASLVAGMSFHDRAYGYLDIHSIGELTEQEWLGIARQGFGMSFSDPVADIIARNHILRLVQNRPVSTAPEMEQEMVEALDEQIGRSGYSKEFFQRIDRITQFTDRISFEFCFERQAQGKLAVYPRNESDETVELSYQIAGESIMIDPLPLDATEVSGYLNAFREAGYPHRLDPVIVPFRISPG